MIIDFHTHIFPATICENRETFFPTEPAFRQLYQSPKSKLIDARALLAVMDENGVEKSVVFGFPWQDSDTFKRHNDYIMETVAKYPDRLIGLGCFDAAHREAAAEADRCVQGGLSGIGELAFYQSGIDDTAVDRLTAIMEICRAADLPVLIHTNEPVGHQYPGKTANTLTQIYSLVTRFSQNRIVLAHWGGGLFFYGLLKREVQSNLANVYFDTAASPYLYDLEIYQVARKSIGLEKILFGSDYPLLSPARYFKEFKQAGLSDEEHKNICGLNAARLLGL